jgi:uncharacterized protein (TIGR03437 family)
VFGVVLFVAAASRAEAEPTAGGIVTHPVSASGPAVLDRAGNLFTATTVLPPAPTTQGAAQPQPGGGTCYLTTPPSASPAPCYSAYIAKADSVGNMVFATYLGGASSSGASAAAVDSSGNIYVAGTAGSPFPTTANAAIPTIPTSTTASFAAKLSADGSKFLYVTYLPACMASPSAIAVDPQGSAYIAGVTSTTNDPANGAFQHACVVKLSADGSAVVYTKILAGSNHDSPAASLSTDASGDAYVTGSTASPDFPVSAGALQSKLSGVQNAFLTKLDPSGEIIFSTYLGGSGEDSANTLRVDASGNVDLAGVSTSLDFPTTAGTLEPQPVVPAARTSPGGFVAKVAPDGKSVVWATYLTSPAAVVPGSGGDLYVFGGAGPGEIPITLSAPLPCALGGPLQAGGDYVVHLSSAGSLLDATYVNQDILGPVAFGLLDNGSLVLAAGGSVAEITFGGPGWSAPPCMTLSPLNAATLNPTPVVAGEFLTFLGSGIGPAVGVAAAFGPQGFPVSLGGVQVFFDGTPAPVLYAQSGQVNVQAPMELSGRSSTAITLTYGGNTFGPVTVPLRFANPGLFRLHVGLTAQAVAENQDASLNSPSNPAAPGSVVTFWGTGFPATSPACPTGGLNPDSAVGLSTTYSVVMTGGGTVQYAGAAPTLACGVTQINMQVPLTTSPGPLLITPGVCTNGGNTCQGVPTGAIIYVQ